MSLRMALLSAMASGPLSGYDLTQRFESGMLAYVWKAKHTQIYPELKRLQDDGLIAPLDEGPRGRKPYRITDAGLAALRRWLTETEPDHSQRNEFILRAATLWLIDADEARRYLEKEARFHEERE